MCCNFTVFSSKQISWSLFSARVTVCLCLLLCGSIFSLLPVPRFMMLLRTVLSLICRTVVHSYTAPVIGCEHPVRFVFWRHCVGEVMMFQLWSHFPGCSLRLLCFSFCVHPLFAPNFAAYLLFPPALCSLGWSPALSERRRRWCGGGGDWSDSVMSLSR